LIHCAGESSPGNIPHDTHAIALAAPDEAALLLLEARLLEENIPHVAVREPDAPFNGALLSIGLRPCYRADLHAVRDILPRLPLIR